ncbi:DUF4252 domain-containing protein [Flavobacterium celericrescens]|uniref:DUF4252 domain-containing protein n=1 Tax=Flavobacterium celericrescens TaxID=2709780 RepID=A0ABX0IBU5_9FLAO|nr:DUF4252 domain-containing protein [Flavobacterium celericrescens]NHM04656.1 DUF4252 domain-containing protein [Flavobacterium celericrescens]
MKKLFVIVVSSILLWSCETKPTLQKYFVKNTESSNFVSVDLAPSIINTEKVTLTTAEKEALQSFEKMNILAFKTDSNDVANYDKEIKEVKSLLKDETYQQLMKVGSGNDGAAVYFVGEDEHIDEFVLLASKKENGFAVVRVLGNDMNPTHILNMLSLLKKSDMNLEQLKPLQELMKK